MSTSIIVALVSFLGMVLLVVQNSRRIKSGKVHELYPMSLYDLARPSLDVWKNTVRGFGHVLWGQVLRWSHIVTFNIGKKFLEVAWMVRGKRKLMRSEAAASRIWKEVAYEKERIRAHFSRTESVVR